MPPQKPKPTTSPTPAAADLPPELVLPEDKYGDPDKPIHVCEEGNAAILEQVIDDNIQTNDVDALFAFLWTLEDKLQEGCPRLRDENPKLHERHQAMIAKGRWYVLSRLTPPEVEELFRNHFHHFFEYEISDVLNAIWRVLAGVPEWAERDLIKKNLRNLIARSQAHVGEKRISVAGVETDPTVESWVKDWKDFLQDREPSPLLIVEYLNTSENAKIITKETRGKVETLFKFYEELRKSSLTPEGSEQHMMVADPDSGTYRLFDRGEMIDTGIKVPKDELEFVRFVMGRDEKTGKILTPAQAIKRNPAYVLPVGVSEEAEAAEEVEAEPAPEPEVHIIAEPEPEEPLPPPPPAPPKPKKKQPKAAPPPAPPPPPPPAPAPKPPKPKRKKAAKPGEIDYNDLAKQVMAEYQLLLPSYEMERRFLSILVSYLKGIRDKMEASDTLSKAPEEGGVNLQTNQIDAILATADELLEAAKRAPTKKAAKPGAEQEKVQAPTFSMAQQMVEERAEVEKAKEPKGAPPPKEEEEVEDIFANISPELDALRSVGPPPPGPTERKQKTIATLAPKKKVTDVTAAAGPGQPLVMGPVDELRNMELEEFRRYSPEPREAAGKIIEKLDLLEEESITKKAEGMDAWKQSPINQLYVEIGNRSLEQAVPVENIISQMKTAGEETLTPDEFKAIADLNKRIRF